MDLQAGSLRPHEERGQSDMTDQQARVMEPRYYTTEQIAELFHTSALAVRHWRERGDGPTGWVKVGRRMLLPADRLAAYEAALREALRAG
jgi:hypothetical protein